ncbi:spliceosome protein-like protein [Citrus sinensis]|nr:spliceosome protein-like protein [Citrus sinensis]
MEMADDVKGSDACAGFKRRVTETPSQDLKEDSSSPIQQHTEETQLGFSKKVKSSSSSSFDEDHLDISESLPERNGELGFTQNQEKVQEKDCVKAEVGSSGIQESIVEGDSKESLATECETHLEAEKNRLLAQLNELGAVFEGNKTHVDNVLNDGETVDGIKVMDGDVGRPVKIQVIDDTALIESVRVPRIGNGCLKDRGIIAGTAKMLQRNEKKQQVDGKKAKRSRRKGKDTKMVSVSARLVQDEKDSGLNNRKEAEIMYSREEMEALKFFNVVQQRKLWRNVYTGLGPAVMNEYDNLACSKHQKPTLKSSDTRTCFLSESAAPGILGKENSKNMEIETEYAGDYEAENMNTTESACSHNTDGEACMVLEGEWSEDYDSDEDYASIQRPAFLVEGEPNFDSGPPEDGLEYLRRVRWEAARIPKVKVAKSKGQKLIKEQTVYMPQIPDIAPCPESLLPLKQWEDQFLADFSKLRLVLSGLDNMSAPSAGKLQPTLTVQNKNHSHHSCEDIIIDKFNDLNIFEFSSDQPLDGFSLKSSIDQPATSNITDDQSSPSPRNPKSSSRDDSGDYPTLSAILRMDSVARVSTLRKRINSVEASGNLSRNDCLWLFALCAAVDTPLDADTGAALRSLLRKCAGLRAGKSELDDEVVMINILATISGRSQEVRAFCSAAIAKRHNTTTLETADGITITLSNLINRSRTNQNGFPSQVCNRFLHGFPFYWEEYADQCCGQEYTNRGSSFGAANISLPLVSLDDIPATRLRDLLISPRGHAHNGALQSEILDVLRQCGCSSVRDKTPSNHQSKAASGRKYRAAVKRPLSRGVVTRSMAKLQTLGSQQNKDSAEFSTQIEGMVTGNGSQGCHAATFSDNDKEPPKSPGNSAVRRSIRLKNQAK